MIIRLPEVMQQTHGIPVKEMDKEKDQSRWMIALGSVSVEPVSYTHLTKGFSCMLLLKTRLNNVFSKSMQLNPLVL